MSSNLNLNKVAAAILVAGLIGMFTGKVTEFLYDGGPKEPGQHDEGKRGYKIDVVETASAGDAGAAPKEAADISSLYATADVKAGGDYVAKKCTVCHNVDKGGANKVGPKLWGVYNRKVASIADFQYSAAMKGHGDRQWSADELNHFLWNPAKWVPGTLMGFAGIAKDQDRANVLAYIAAQSDTPAKLPAAKK